MNNEAQKKWFKQSYGLGEKRIETGYGWPLEVEPELKNLIEEIKKTLPTGKVLDLGCGQGRHTIYCAEKGFESYGIDYIERAIEEAKQKAKEKNLKNAYFKTMDILQLDFPEDFFDVIIDCSVLDHIKYSDWNKYLENITKVLKMGRFLILIEFSANDPRINEKTRHLYEHKDRPFPHSLYFENEDHYDHYFNEKEIRELFSKNFKVISIKETILSQHSNIPDHLMVNVLLKRIS